MPVNDFLIFLVPVGLLDGLTMLPVGTAILMVVLAGPRPFVASVAFFLGIILVYSVLGVALLIGLESLFEYLRSFALRVRQNPKTEELIFQAVLGVLLCVFGLRFGKSRRAQTKLATIEGLSPGRAFITSSSLTVLSLPGAIPYFAAVDLILREEIPFASQLVALLAYNLMFILPLVGVGLAAACLGQRRERLLEIIQRIFSRRGQKVTACLLVILGVVLAVDAIALFFDARLIPV